MFTVHFLSMFTESLSPYLDTSIMKRAQEKGLFRYFTHNLTDWTVRNTRRVDDRPYGGGAGTILTIEPLTNSIRDIQSEYGKMRILYFSPRGRLWNQEYAETMAQSAETPYLILCGHYEGIDERIFSLFEIEEISIGEYVLSSGELASLVWTDSVVRILPGVISEESLREESFSQQLGRKKEYPQYSRPEFFENLTVPQELLSGDHERIRLWKQQHLLD